MTLIDLNENEQKLYSHISTKNNEHLRLMIPNKQEIQVPYHHLNHHLLTYLPLPPSSSFTTASFVEVGHVSPDKVPLGTPRTIGDEDIAGAPLTASDLPSGLDLRLQWEPEIC